MDKEEKRRLANERRLKAVQQWQKNKTQQRVVRNFPAKLEPVVEPQNKLTLFGSDEENDDFEKDFSARPQYKGAHGQHFLELNSELQGDFRIDDRFATVDDVDENSEICEKQQSNFNEDDVSKKESEIDHQAEKTKNMQILESVLGCAVKEKYTDGKKKRKNKIVRFDPEDECSSKYLKTVYNSGKVSSTKSQNKESNNSQIKEIPVFAERYVDVDSNLKDILSSTSTPFSFSKTFEASEDLEDFQDTFVKCQETENSHLSGNKDKQKKLGKTPHNERNQFTERRNYSFFISEGHPFLKQGVEFWVTSNLSENQSEEWNAKKEKAMTLFKHKKRVAKRRNTNANPQRRNQTKISKR